jgi:predicted Zn-dependent protease
VVVFKRTFKECDSENCVAGILAHEATHTWLKWLIDTKSNLPRNEQQAAEEVLADQVALLISPANPIILSEEVNGRHVGICQDATKSDCKNPAQIMYDFYKIEEIFNISSLVYGR